MKILRPICAGLDVHKNVIVATLGITDMNTQITQYLQESFSTLNCDLYRLRDWLLDHHCHDVCMESTGKYWIPVFNILEAKTPSLISTFPSVTRPFVPLIAESQNARRSKDN